MKLNLLFLALALLTMTGCAVSPIRAVDQTLRSNVDYPNVGEKVTKGLGERLVAKGVRTTGEAIEITEVTQFNKADGESSVMTCAVTVQPGSVFKRGVYETESRRGDCYGPVNYQSTLADGSVNWNCPGRMGVGDICVDSSGNYFIAFLNVQFELKQDFNHIKKVNKVVERQENFIQEFIYNGRIGDYLKFIYREFSDNMARPAFTQEVQYDLAASHIIGFKGLRLEVIEASNTEITYKLISNF